MQVARRDARILNRRFPDRGGALSGPLGGRAREHAVVAEHREAAPREVRVRFPSLSLLQVCAERDAVGSRLVQHLRHRPDVVLLHAISNPRMSERNVSL